MTKRFVLIAALALIIGLPFWLRPKENAGGGGAGSPAGAGPLAEVLVVITPHNEAIRHEFGRGFAEWHRERTGRCVVIDWRVVGGTSEIARFLEGEYGAAFELHWRRDLGRAWSAEARAAFHNGRLPADASAVEREARAAFLVSEVGCGIDVFFGGGTYDFERQARAGRIVDSGVLRAHPEWFREEVIPRVFAGEEYWDGEGRWFGTVLSSYGIVVNFDALARLGVPWPRQWEDLRNARLAGEIALADPTKSGSIAKAFENVIQQQMQRRFVALRAAREDAGGGALEARAVREGWLEGLRLVQGIGANSRYFTDSSQKPPVDVAQGDSAAGLCIDFYGRQQEEAVARRAGSARVGFVSPAGGSVASVDPVALLRGAPHRETAVLFIEYVLSMEGQKLWNFKPGAPGGPRQYALRRLPVRRDFYERPEFSAWRSDPEVSPYGQGEQLVYRAAWTGGLFREMAFVIRVMCLDTHPELVRAWRAIIEAGMPAEALAAMQDLSAVDYDAARTRIKQALASRNRADEIRLADELAHAFRRQYRAAERLARGKN
ncbi:MAG: extracellular solute-binding protein [Opitutaceae bacterium]|jgi:ABC-type Fe3+ transport system substrate-binding protein|nr:extracellular solute-binding protein [Opitutaceae bacterium]